MTDERIARDLGLLEEQPAVRSAFAAGLRERLHDELGFTGSMIAPAAAPGSPTGPTPPPDASRRRWWPATPKLRPLTLRTVMVAALLVLLLAAVVAAAGLALRQWLSSGDGAPQATDDFALREVYREPGAFYDDLRIAPDGRTLMGLRVPVAWPGREPADGAVVRFEPTDDGGMAPVDVLPFERLRDPALWDRGTYLEGATLAPSIGGPPGFDTFSVAPNGDLFLAISAFPSGHSGPLGPSSIVVAHPDGSIRKVLTTGELLASGLLDARFEELIGMTAVASAPDLLWLRVDAPIEDPAGTASQLLQVVDPDADGDWSDRIVRPIVVPETVPLPGYGVYDRLLGSLVAEPSTAGVDRSRSVLVPVIADHGRFTVHRLTDRDDDGDLTDAGEVELVVETLTSGGMMDAPVIAPRVVIQDGRVTIDELMAGGISRASRLSRLTAAGIVDVVRALPTSSNAVAAASDGPIYLTSQAFDEQAEVPIDQLYRLDPVAEGSEPPPGAVVVPAVPSMGAASSPAPNGLLEVGPVSPNAPAIAFQAVGSSGEVVEAYLVGADGSGPERLVPGQAVWELCRSADGTRIVHRAIADVPNEPWLFATAADSGETSVTSETLDAFWCGPPDAVLLGTGQEPSYAHQSILRHDLVTGDERVLVEDATVLAVSPDGGRVAVSDEPDRSSVAVIDISTGARVSVADAGDRVVRAAWWAPDGSALAWVASDAPLVDPTLEADLVVGVADAAGGGSRELTSVHGRQPEVSWSADSSRLLVRVPTSGPSAAGTFVLDTPEAPLWLIDVASGEARPVRDGGVRWAAWSPVDSDRYAVATSDTLWLEDVEGGSTRLTDRPTEPLCSACWLDGQWPVERWLGWSPDGRLIGLGKDSGAIAVVDVGSGDLRVLAVSTDEAGILEPRWWR